MISVAFADRQRLVLYPGVEEVTATGEYICTMILLQSARDEIVALDRLREQCREGQGFHGLEAGLLVGH